MIIYHYLGYKSFPACMVAIFSPVFLEKVIICDSNSIPRDCRSALASLQGAQNKAVYISTLLSDVILIATLTRVSEANTKQNIVVISASFFILEFI